jgi:hypothetical protein
LLKWIDSATRIVYLTNLVSQLTLPKDFRSLSRVAWFYCITFDKSILVLFCPYSFVTGPTKLYYRQITARSGWSTQIRVFVVKTMMRFKIEAHKHHGKNWLLLDHISWCLKSTQDGSLTNLLNLVFFRVSIFYFPKIKKALFLLPIQ